MPPNTATRSRDGDGVPKRSSVVNGTLGIHTREREYGRGHEREARQVRERSKLDVVAYTDKARVCRVWQRAATLNGTPYRART